MRLCMSALSLPGLAMPVRSPLMSARNTGTPMSEKDSAMTFMVTVLPVPVAPAIRPWRFAMLGSRKMRSSDLAIQILLSVNMYLSPYILYL